MRRPNKPAPRKPVAALSAAVAPLFPMRITKYLAWKGYCTRRDADSHIEAGKVLINGKRAKLGDKVNERDAVDVQMEARKYRYIAYNKPRGIITHSAGEDEQDIQDLSPVPGVFPMGRLDKDSTGLIILSDDGRITDKLLNPDYAHEKEYTVTVKEKLSHKFKQEIEPGVNIEGYHTKPCKVRVLGDHKFSIIITEGKKHQIRRMCAALGYVVSELKRRRVMNIQLGKLKPGQFRNIEGEELGEFLVKLGV